MVPEDNVIAQTKNGKQVLNVGKGNEAQACAPATGDMMAVVGDNRKIIIFPLDELPEMTRGRGVKLQSYKDGGLADLTTFIFKEGLLLENGCWTPYRNRYQSLRRQAVPGRAFGHAWFPRNNRFGNYE